jgi:hypothetical protein
MFKNKISEDEKSGGGGEGNKIAILESNYTMCPQVFSNTQHHKPAPLLFLSPSSVLWRLSKNFSNYTPPREKFILNSDIIILSMNANE